MNSPFLLSSSELESMVAERQLMTPEKFKPNDFYGHASILKRYAGLPNDFVIRGVMPHGPSFCSKLWETELKDSCTTILAISEQQRQLYAQQSPHKTVRVIGAALLYAARQMEEELNILRSGASGTVVFPTHSTHHVTVEFDHAQFIAFLKSLPAEFHPIRVCLYWRDIQLGRQRDYESAGFECVTAGHMFDPEFVPRVLRILSAHRHVVANKLGSCVYYAAALGIPVKLYQQPSTYTGKNSAQLAELSPELDLPAAVRFATTASLPLAEAAPIQRELALAELGSDFLLTPVQLLELLLSLPGAPALPAKPTTPHFKVEATTDSLVPQLKAVYSRHPRRVPGKVKLDGRPWAYADLHSLYHQAQQIFVQKLYDFKAVTDTPVIIDGGAHIGLASLYFARRFPKSTIHAFEADPKIAALLAANISAFDLNQVTLHDSALWTNNDGVSFAATADDSGHVTSGNQATVSSVRLRDFLGKQPVDLLKLDIEGAEFAVIKDCDGALDGVRNLLIEVHRFRDDDGRLGELLAVLDRNGFDYALGDLHPAGWIETTFRPPFSACKTKHYLVTVFAWKARALPETTRQLPAGTIDLGSGVHEALALLNARREKDALGCFDRLLAGGSAGPRLHYGRSIALARLNHRKEAVDSLTNLLRIVPGFPKARALLAELTAQPVSQKP